MAAACTGSIDGLDKRHRRGSCGVGRRRGYDGCCETQTAGRGRHGRIWFRLRGRVVCVGDRPARTGLGNDENPAALLTLASGSQLPKRYAPLPDCPEIKWPNEVLIDGRKLAGILAEAAVQAGVLQFIVVGFGVNLQPAAYPPQLASRVTSIEVETTRPPSAVDTRGDPRGAGEPVRRSEGRKVRCYSERWRQLARRAGRTR